MDAVFFISFVLAAIFFSAGILSKISGAHVSFAMSCSLYSLFVLVLPISSKVDSEGGKYTLLVIGAMCGGLGASMLWACQGAYVNKTVEIVTAVRAESKITKGSKISEQKRRELKEGTSSKFTGFFALIFLVGEVVLKSLSSVVSFSMKSKKSSGGMSWYDVIFTVYISIAVLSGGLLSYIVYLNTNNEASSKIETSANPKEDDAKASKKCGKRLVITLRLCGKNKKSVLLAPKQMLFGSMMALTIYYVDAILFKAVIGTPSFPFIHLGFR